MAICKGEEYGEILENGSFSFCFLNGILFEIFSVFLFLFGCLRIRFELNRSFPGATLRHTLSSIGSHFWSGFKTAFKGWKLYRFVFPLHLILLIFPLIVNFVYSRHLQSSTLISVPPFGLLMFTAVSTTLAWIWSFITLVVEQQSEALGHPFARPYFWTLPTFWSLQFIFVANNAWALHIKEVGGAPYWVTIIYTLPTALLAIYGLFKHQTTAPHQNVKYQRVVESTDEEEDESLQDPKTNLHPSESASFFSKLYLVWLNPLLLLGYNRPLQETDIYPVPSRMRADYIGDKFEENWSKEKLKSDPALFWTVLRTLGFRVVWPGFLKIIYDLLAFVGPNIIGYVIRYLNDPDMPAHYGYLYVAIMLCSVLAQSLLQNHYFFAMFGTGIQARAALSAVIYKKAFILSSKSRQKSTIGEIVNHQAIDARRVQDLMPWFHLLWSSPLQIGVAMVLLYRGLGVSMFAGFAIMALMLPINYFMTKWQNSIQTQNMERKDARIKMLNEVVNAIRVIKIFAWEGKFASRIHDIRDRELLVMRRAAYFLAIQTFLWVAAPLLVSMATFGTYVLLGNELTAEHVFTSLSLFNVLRQPLNMLPEVINRAVGARVSLKRIRAYLLTEEVDANAVQTDTQNKSAPISVQINQASFKWATASDIETNTPTLQNINVKIPNGKLVAVVGKVGSGKTSFLSAILGDIPKLGGTVSVNGRIAYVSQDPWIQNASVKDNITMGALGRTFDTEKYNQTVSVCQLSRDLQILPNGDATEIGEKGINLSGGQKQRVSLARAVYSDADVYLFDDCLSAVDAQVGQSIFENCIKNQLENKTRIFVTHQLQFLNRADYILVIKDGQITESGSYDELMTSQGEFQALVNEFISHETKEAEKQEEVSEESSEEEKKEAPKMKKLMTKEDRETGTVNIRIYKLYLLSLGSSIIGIILFSVFSLEFAGKIGTDLWLSYWSSLDIVNNSSVRFYLAIYFSLGGSVCLLVLFRSTLCFLRAIVASRNLHNAMLDRVLRAPLSFFDTTPIGRILNRFSKDQQTIDEELPESLSDLVTNIYNVIAVLFVVAFVTPFFIAVLLPLSALYRYIQKYYLQSSREIKRLDSITRSPIFAQMSETLSGVKTIRAFGLENDFITVNNRKIDVNTSVQYCNVASNRWLSVRLESVSGSVVSCAALFAVLQKGSIDPGFAGLSIVYALQLTNMLNGMVRNYSLVETNLISVERVIKYSELPSEAPAVIPSKRPPAQWPQAGSIEFKNVQLRYREGLDMVLKNTSFEVKPQEKIGIVGRTGAGKSSLMVALFRLVELSGGSIVIDGINISDIGLNDLRSKLSMIPQDPTLFEGTIRSNMDPFEEYTDAEIWKALDSVHMKDPVAALPQKLEHIVTESGQNFSTGQRQLFCLGRALLRKSKVLVLDEATASVDFETDSLIQNTIRKEFQDCTVLTIAHRINTILDSDRVMVMDSGSVAEYDKPSVLVQNPNSRFAIMLKHQSNVKSNYQTK